MNRRALICRQAGRWIAPALFLIAAVYLLAIPLIRPRGAYLHGHYRVLDLYLGAPALISAILSAGVALAPQRRRRLLGFKLFTASVSAFSALLVADGSLALLAPHDFWTDVMGPPGLHNEPDPVLGWRRKAFASSTVRRTRYTANGDEQLDFQYACDANGFRNPPLSGPRVGAVIGDSFTEASEVPREECFAARVGERLGVEVENLGRSGYGPPQELEVLRQIGLRTAPPKWVVWQLYEGNDLPDTVRFLQWRRNPSTPGLPLSVRYIEYSPLLRWIGKQRTPGLGVLQRLPGGRLREAVRLTPYVPTAPDTLPGALEGVQASLQEGQSLCRAAGVRLLVLYIPNMMRVQSDLFVFPSPKVRGIFLPEGQSDSPHDFESRITRYCRDQSIDFASLTPLLRKRRRAGDENLYVPFDGHLDRSGHEVAAQVICNWVTREQP